MYQSIHSPLPNHAAALRRRGHESAMGSSTPNASVPKAAASTTNSAPTSTCISTQQTHQPAPNPAPGPRPLCYISRGFNILVPLIAVDDLPYDVHIRGIPRAVSSYDVSGMKYVGQFPASRVKYSLTPERQMFMSGNVVVDGEGEGKERQVEGGGGNRGVKREELDGSKGQEQVSDTWSAREIGPTHRPLPPSGAEPDRSRKQFCTYWLRNGECDFIQQGCLYKHEMPSLAVLAQIGFRGYPRWYLDRKAQQQNQQQNKKREAKKKGVVRALMPAVDCCRPLGSNPALDSDAETCDEKQRVVESRRTSVASEALIDWPVLTPDRSSSSQASAASQSCSDKSGATPKMSTRGYGQPGIVEAPLPDQHRHDRSQATLNNQKATNKQHNDVHVRPNSNADMKESEGLVPIELLDNYISAGQDRETQHKKKHRRSRRNKSKASSNQKNTADAQSEVKEAGHRAGTNKQVVNSKPEAGPAITSSSNSNIPILSECGHSKSKRPRPSRHQRQRKALQAQLQREKEKNRALLEKAGVRA